MGLLAAGMTVACATAADPNTGPSPWGGSGPSGQASATAADDPEAVDESEGSSDGGEAPQVEPMEGGDSTGGGGVQGDCCAPSATPGCADAAVEACVCAQDPVCCEQPWDAVCVAAVDDLQCGSCGADPPGGDTGGFPPPEGGACCMPGAMPGCADMNVAQCVCAEDPFCCEMQWDETCVEAVDALGCGACGGGGDDGGQPPPGGNCCAPTGMPGCGDPAVEECICGANGDLYCCFVEWDDLCAEAVAELGCGPC